MRITDKINFRQPKYMLPAIVYIPLIATGYFVFDMFNTEVAETQDKNLQTTEFLNPNLPGAQIKNGDGIGGKYENMAKSYGRIADYSAVDNIERDNEEEKEAYESKYTEEDLAELVRQAEEKDDAAEVADAKAREAEALEALNKALAEARLRGQAAVAPVAQDTTQAGPDVPLIVAPGQEDEYLEVKARQDAEAEKEKKAEPRETPDSSTEEATPSVAQQEETALQTNGNGWDGLLQSFGLNGFSDIGKNLGYVLAMLPDVLVGLFTGKTKSLNMDNSLLPLASIVAGMFVKNPILKMLLMGMGGANLLNKAGHEVLGRKQQEGIAPTVSPATSRIQYRQYPDEPLNPRISNPMLQGRCLVANIDHVPCTIQLPDSVIGAHQSGALPLNTLANAILAKNDQMRQVAAVQYEEQARESVVRARGIQ